MSTKTRIPLTPGRMLYLTRRRMQLGFRHWIAERFVDTRIDHWRIPEALPEAPVPVHLLTSRHDWRMALWMLASLHEATSLRWRIMLHEDGSLETEAAELFQKLFPGLRVIRRAEADAAMKTRLAARPRCAAYRSAMPHGLKAFDIPSIADSLRFLLIDPDVLFFSRPEKILNWAADDRDESCWFNEDFQEPSPLSPATAEQDIGVKLWPRVNSGLCLLTRSTVSDLDAMECWLGHAALQAPSIQWRVEQTLLALSASRVNRGGLLPPAYEVSASPDRRAGCVARHYVGCVRQHFLREGVNTLADIAPRR